ncbi:MAG: threonine/serine exporter family protein [Ancalomicrobiaceae bacterium]|nr:threonine/serine exporter family protein [Ancalomicrobiaceae bacterium]
MVIDLMTLAPRIAHQALFGGIAAAGFGVLFNFGSTSLVRCTLLGAWALAVRTFFQMQGWSLEASSFVAALTTATLVHLVVPKDKAFVANGLAIAGCIPMVPGAFFTDALMGFLQLTSQSADQAAPMMTHSLTALLRVIFTLGAIGTGLTIPAQLARTRF